MLTYALEKNGSSSLYTQLYGCIRRDILSGALPPRQKLPSKRALAQHLEVSVITVKNAYEQLAAEGYIYTVEKKGYYVSPVERPLPPADPPPLTPEKPAEPVFLDLATGSLDRSYFPFTVWSRLMRQTILEEDTVRKLLPQRPRDGHKGTFGKVLLLAGSKPYPGAPIMASHTATHSGAGLVFLGIPETIYPITALKCVEEMPVALPDEQGALGEASVPVILEKLTEMQAALIGPGLGKLPQTQEVVKQVLKRCACPVVLDADGINAIAGHMDVLDSRSAPTVLTPHDGEFHTLTGQWPGKDRLSTALDFAKAHHCVLVLKGHRTIVAGPDGRAYLNTTGNDGLAKGGSGDVLAGLITSFLAQGMDALEAAAAAVWIHGKAGDQMAEQYGRRGMTASNVMLEGIPAVLKELE